MIKTKTIDFNGRKITVKELTVAQVDSWMEKMAETAGTEKPHILDVLMGRDLPVSAVLLAVPELTDDDLVGEVAPCEIEQLYNAVEEVNGFLSSMSKRLVALSGVQLRAGVAL